MLFFPNAKINIGLNILRKRTDGFHDIASYFYPVGWKDVLEILPNETFSFNTTGITIPPDGKDNLCVRAYELLKKDFDIPLVYLHLHKNIPIGAGMGGGSADASMVLVGLNKLFELHLTTAQMIAYATQLGSDCAFFVENKAQYAHGRGELLEATAPDLKGTKICVVYPNLHITTAEAYQRILPALPALPLYEAIALPRTTWKEVIQNDFEAALFPQYPILPAIKAKLYEMGAFYAAMTGSGSAVYGLFEQAMPAEITFSEIYTVWKGEIL